MRAVILLAALVACGSRSAPAATAADAGVGVRVLVDDAPVATLTPADFANRRALADVVPVPVAAWRQLEVAAPGGRTMIAQHFDEDVIAYLDGGRPAIGLYRRAADLPAQVRDLAAAPARTLAGVTEIRIRTHEVARADAPPAQIELRAGPRHCVLDAAALAAIPTQIAARGNADRPAWDVTDLARAYFQAAPIHVAAGNVQIDTTRLGDRRVVAKVNRKGQLVVRLVETTGHVVLQSAAADAIELTLPPGP